MQLLYTIYIYIYIQLLYTIISTKNINGYFNNFYINIIYIYYIILYYIMLHHVILYLFALKNILFSLYIDVYIFIYVLVLS